jgi:cell division protein FtsB
MARKGSKSQPATLKEYIFLGFLSVGLVWLIMLNVKIFPKEEIARHAAQNTARQLASLQARQTLLQKNITELSTPRGEEATMRETFGVARPGEGVIIVVPPKVATTTPPITFWQKWFGWAVFWKKASSS